MYDCTADVLKHQDNVRKFLRQIIEELVERQIHHDESKLQEPEKSIYDEFTPRLYGITYESQQYKDCIREMGEAIRHHHKSNRHHPEYFDNGVNGMNLLDLVEMLADWKAATLRHADGDIRRSIHINKEKFKMDDQLFQILVNTIKDLDW